MRIDILTLFPGMFRAVFAESMLKIAQDKELVELRMHNIRDYSHDKHKCVDDKPYGGGGGMVLKPEPLFRAVESVDKQDCMVAKKILLTPQGKTFDQQLAIDLAQESRLMFICGRYEGFDERIRLGIELLEVSIGDYVLTGGEIPAMVMTDAIVRLIPGVLGGKRSLQCESFMNKMLDYPQYTRPEVFRGMKVPEILRSGNHRSIEEWRNDKSEKKTEERRPDLLEK
ncbi:MAG: tRNA (guanosine(37)-N1)-methyltransferase TrmD [Candidatus Scalindua sp. AMX11]|nr:MAG: tRNA (guanosine(37)-N1)-methyltransferase TrmD [Candidatus Scalindua sp.]NOG82723.1 tRNA (guanosine(37)-N1)-methyltransferase TrmD [Planctomycetota bacterium]RZV95293.1 MAG: tRNA (guanosine(37)-N1)-methyltransferase TrmD [Candidatus Scalindua sp. SCAELEC01]TDE66226.1 MAG: tRNA (guanosine(37)-N1)-methyltransferase TrmD [Candidatus Scalindua sp. AMX11]GJQ57846.1 MAG: tRNA (guanine-N(1)-)-methyltransferase [Candidatus Scalindua sp.]